MHPRVCVGFGAAAVALAGALGAGVAGAPPVAADETTTTTVLVDEGIDWTPVVYPMFFPVVAPVIWEDDFGDPRGTDRLHHGQDLPAPKGTPVVAAAAGTVDWMDAEQGGECCALALDHDDGWASWYIHLDNDTPGTDDGLGWGFAPGIAEDVHVEAGQVIGYVGDSGNAEDAMPHLHFELHDDAGMVRRPAESLIAAAGGAAALPPPPPAFTDIDNSPHAADIVALAALGWSSGCAPETFCPTDPVTRGEMAVFLDHALPFGDSPDDAFADDDGHFAEEGIDRLAAQGVTAGCDATHFCPHAGVTRAEMAVFLVRSLGLDASTGADRFGDDDGHWAEAWIDVLAGLGITAGCDAGAYCPDEPVTREEMATFLVRLAALL